MVRFWTSSGTICALVAAFFEDWSAFVAAALDPVVLYSCSQRAGVSRDVIMLAREERVGASELASAPGTAE